jgi:hypothetical protein
MLLRPENADGAISEPESLQTFENRLPVMKAQCKGTQGKIAKWLDPRVVPFTVLVFSQEYVISICSAKFNVIEVNPGISLMFGFINGY